MIRTRCGRARSTYLTWPLTLSVADYRRAIQRGLYTDPIPPTPLPHLEHTLQNDPPPTKKKLRPLPIKLSFFHSHQHQKTVYTGRHCTEPARCMTAWYVRGGGLPAVYRSGRQAEEPCHGVSVGRRVQGVCRMFCTVDSARAYGAQQDSHCSRSEETTGKPGKDFGDDGDENDA